MSTTETDLTEGEPNPESDYVGATPKSDPFEERPDTRQNGCKPEPLDDSADDCYRLHQPIADSTEAVGDSRYLEDGEPLTAFDAVGTYIRRRHGENVSAEKHGFDKNRQWRRKRQYAMGKEMDRQLLERFENPTTTLLSLRLSPGDRSRLTLLTGLHGAIGPTLDQLRYRLQEAPDAPISAEEWQYIAVVAGTRERATPHLHILVWCDGDVPRSRFRPVVEKFTEKCPYASKKRGDNSPDGGAIRIHGNGDNSIPRIDDAGGESQAATYVLTQLPHLQEVDDMARDELLHSSTVDAWDGKAFRKSQYTVWDDDEPAAETVSGVEPTLSDESGGDELTETERAFVTQYVEAVGDYSEGRIIDAIEENADKFEGMPNPERIVPRIQEKLQSD